MDEPNADLDVVDFKGQVVGSGAMLNGRILLYSRSPLFDEHGFSRFLQRVQRPVSPRFRIELRQACIH